MDFTAVLVTNAHTHLDLTGLARICPSRPSPFVAWLCRCLWYSGWPTRERVRANVERSIEELKACGTTHVCDVTATWQSVEPLLASGLQGTVYLEVRGVDRSRALRRLEQVKEAIREAQAYPGYGRMGVGLALHAPYSCHPHLLCEAARWCRAEGVPLCTHVAESPVEMELLQEGSASSVRWRTRLVARWLGVWPSHVPRLRPVTYLSSLGVLAARPLLVHGVHVTEEEIRLIADVGCAVVHCPRSNERLQCGRMPLERYLEAGVSVYLGTESRASSPSLDVCEEADFAQGLHAGIVDPQAIAALVHQPPLEAVEPL
jgi:cytosine/adenosine deaminase-related metal-dependent hydrolase